MAGIYLHIPFCKQACHYCNFHFSTSRARQGEMVEAIIRELTDRRNELAGLSLDTVYFGGGTPSLLSETELERIFATIHRYWVLGAEAEITLEANPDDLTEDKLQQLSRTPINRLSIGIQSFAETDLQFMNRAHNAREAEQCIAMAQAAGFTNLTIDLIYGSPTTSDAVWRNNLQKAISYGIPHLSSYALTVEPKTALAHQIAQAKLPPLSEEKAARQFEILQEMSSAAGYEQYEVSNFAKAGAYARHNTAYWQGEAYLGIGPAAHSYNGSDQRRWNMAHNAKYLQALASQKATAAQDWYTIEQLSKTDQYNEYILTGLRTKWGCDLTHIRAIGERYHAHCVQELQQYANTELLQQKQNIFKINQQFLFLADGIAANLFYIDNQ